MFADMCTNVSLCLACVFYASHTQRLITKLRQEDITGEILKCDDSVECTGVGVGCFSLQTICSSSRWEQSHTGIKPVLTFKSKKVKRRSKNIKTTTIKITKLIIILIFITIRVLRPREFLQVKLSEDKDSL